MSQTCDRCGPAVRASYRVERTGELFLCGHCANRHWPMLSAQGWIIRPTGVHALAPQASSALDKPCPPTGVMNATIRSNWVTLADVPFTGSARWRYPAAESPVSDNGTS
jgi:hypothetical protein